MMLPRWQRRSRLLGCGSPDPLLLARTSREEDV